MVIPHTSHIPPVQGMLVLGSALFMEALGLSMALGTFIAGVLLAESEYRHELEIAIDPFNNWANSKWK